MFIIQKSSNEIFSVLIITIKREGKQLQYKHDPVMDFTVSDTF